MNSDLALVLFSSFALAGCGVTIESRRISTDKVPSFIAGEGVVYALPKTQFQISQPLKVSVPTSGLLRDVIDSCRRACAANAADTAKACAVSAAPAVLFAIPELKTFAVPDSTRLYQVSAAADVFQTLDFKFDISSNGVLEKADASASNNVYEVASAVITDVIKAASIAKAGSSVVAKLQGIASKNNRSCYQTIVDIDGLGARGSPVLACSTVGEVDQCMAALTNSVKEERDALNQLFDSARRDKTDPKLLTLLAANRKERIDAAVARRDEAATLYGLAEGKPKEATFQLLIPLQEAPGEFKPFAETIGLAESAKRGTVLAVPISENATPLLPTLFKAIREEKRVYVVTSAPSKGVAAPENAAQADPDVGGYRYRVPMPAQTSLSVYPTANELTTPLAGPIVQQTVIAQYGPVAALPSKFKGKGGKVVVKLWPEFGGLQTVEIGADALPASAVTGVVDQTVTGFKDRKAAAAAAAASAAAVDPELDTLTRQQKLLALQKEIKDLQQQLKD